ncbi:MAG: hypothetical protein ACRDCE_16770 [Cetobacterium sp.]|uniref:hypothetical protein n=1 Tax=Cetobacterium sp. TaxID=2071632 RepID=UPI003EE6B1A7
MRNKIIDPNYVNEKKVTKAVIDLVSKYFEKVNTQVVKWDVKDDLMKFKNILMILEVVDCKKN